MTTSEIYDACSKIAAMRRKARRLHVSRLVRKSGCNIYDLQDIIGLYIAAAEKS
jgi:hypothetical protein